MVDYTTPVQVKSATRAFTFIAREGKGRTDLGPAHVYVLHETPTDTWYIVPTSYLRHAGVKAASVGPRSWLNEWRDAWSVFTPPATGWGRPPLPPENNNRA